MRIPKIPIPLDAEGFLCKATDWNKDVAELVAKKEGIILTQAHWEIINLLRDFYYQFQTIPTMRKLVTLAKDKLGNEKGKSIYLYQLFPGNPMLYVCKIAGLPKPKHCL